MTEHPELSNGYAPIANEIIEALARTPMSSYEAQCLWFIFRKTYGWGKKDDWISLSQFVEGTGISKPHVCRALRLLVEKRIITKGGNASLPKGAMNVAFNKYHSQWRALPKGANSHKSLPKGATNVTKRGNESLPKGAPTIDTPTTDTITKDISARSRKEPHAGVQAIIDAMKECHGGIDDSEAKNRRYAWLLLQKADMNVGMCVALVRAASQHDFWGRVKKIEGLYRNAARITADLKSSQPTNVLIAG